MVVLHYAPLLFSPLTMYDLTYECSCLEFIGCVVRTISYWKMREEVRTHERGEEPGIKNYSLYVRTLMDSKEAVKISCRNACNFHMLLFIRSLAVRGPFLLYLNS